MTEPPLHNVRRHIGLESDNPKCVAESFRACWRAGDSGSCHDRFHAAPRRRSAPRPEPLGKLQRIMLRGAQVKMVIQLPQERRRERHLTDDASAAALESLECRDAAVEIKGSTRKSEGL